MHALVFEQVGIKFINIYQVNYLLESYFKFVPEAALGVPESSTSLLDNLQLHILEQTSRLRPFT